MCDIWKIRDRKEINVQELESLCQSFCELGVSWVVLTGGEPQLHSDFRSVTRALKSRDIRVTLLTAGLLLSQEAELVAENIDDVIVSLDGPADVHDRIRRVDGAYSQIQNGILELKKARADMLVRARCTIQSANHNVMCDTVKAARQAGFESISFLAADLTSTAFNREKGWSITQQNRVALTVPEVTALEKEIEHLIDSCGGDLSSGFIVETPVKLRKIAKYFRAHLGETSHVAPRCNAPWVSMVVDANGDVRPCFFHPPYGNIHEQTLGEILNGPRALHFRSTLDVEANPTCQRCVCSLHLRESSADTNVDATTEIDFLP
jgi:MoaA/NifB/PqqE/SkfB family radical SAM enzyme